MWNKYCVNETSCGGQLQVFGPSSKLVSLYMGVNGSEALTLCLAMGVGLFFGVTEVYLSLGMSDNHGNVRILRR